MTRFLPIVVLVIACAVPPDGAINVSRDPLWSAQLAATTEAWSQDATLPSIGRCRLDRVWVLELEPDAYRDRTGFCAPGNCPNGPSTACPWGCSADVAWPTGVDRKMVYTAIVPIVDGYETPGFRHSVAHYLSFCTTGSFDTYHRDRRVWDGVLDRAAEAAP